MTSQLVIFKAFLFTFFRPPPPPSPPQIWKKIPVNQLIKKIWPYYACCIIFCAFSVFYQFFLFNLFFHKNTYHCIKQLGPS